MDIDPVRGLVINLANVRAADGTFIWYHLYTSQGEDKLRLTLDPDTKQLTIALDRDYIRERKEWVERLVQDVFHRPHNSRWSKTRDAEFRNLMQVLGSDLQALYVGERDQSGMPQWSARFDTSRTQTPTDLVKPLLDFKHLEPRDFVSGMMVMRLVYPDATLTPGDYETKRAQMVRACDGVVRLHGGTGSPPSAFKHLEDWGQWYDINVFATGMQNEAAPSPEDEDEDPHDQRPAKPTVDIVCAFSLPRSFFNIHKEDYKTEFPVDWSAKTRIIDALRDTHVSQVRQVMRGVAKKVHQGLREKLKLSPNLGQLDRHAQRDVGEVWLFEGGQPHKGVTQVRHNLCAHPWVKQYQTVVKPTGALVKIQPRPWRLSPSLPQDKRTTTMYPLFVSQ